MGRVNGRIIVVKLLVGKTIMTVVLAYAPKCGLDEEKDSSDDLVKSSC